MGFFVVTGGVRLKGFVVGGGKFGAHLKIVVPFTTLVSAIPVNAFERSPGFPLCLFVGGEGGGEVGGIGQGGQG